jgi:hypothetical protein
MFLTGLKDLTWQPKKKNKRQNNLEVGAWV